MLAALLPFWSEQAITRSWSLRQKSRLYRGSMVAERISGQTWEDFATDRFAKPLGMVHTGFLGYDLSAPSTVRLIPH